MTTSQSKLIFKVLLNNAFSGFNDDKSITPDTNKRVLSLINDYEDAKWRYDKFHGFVWDNIVQTALSAEERQKLSQRNHTILTEAAKALRLTDDSKQDGGRGSELAEIIMYGIMKDHYSALPVVPKIFYKQNNQDYARGADSVHIVVRGCEFSIWLGEAKFYKSIEDTHLGSIVQSVGNVLATKKLKKENSIITNVRDLDFLVSDVALKSKIKDALSPEHSIDDLKPRLNIPILLLHECEVTKKTTSLTSAYETSITEYHKQRAKAYFKKQIAQLGNAVDMYQDITFHLILFPVPDKNLIVEKFLASVKHYKGD